MNNITSKRKLNSSLTGAQMRVLRAELNLSQSELAKKIGCSKSLIGNLECYGKTLSKDVFYQLKKRLELNNTDLFAFFDERGMLTYDQKLFVERYQLFELKEPTVTT